MKKNDSKYWLHQSSSAAISYLEDFRSQWTSWNTSPIRQSWIRNYLAYYSPVMAPGSSDTSMIFEGVQGELVRFFTPKARTLIQQKVTLITKQRLAAQAVANASSADVMDDLKLGNALLDQVIQNERLDLKGRELIEGSLVCGSWFTETSWRTDKGHPYTRGENGAIIYTGSVNIAIKSIFDVFYDVNISEWSDLDFVETRSSMNRYNLIAQHPELEQEILSLPSITETRGYNGWFDKPRGESDDDVVDVYKMYAKPSASLPLGRLLIYSADNCVYFDDENIYGSIPVEPCIPEKVLGTGFGYPQLTSLTAAQEMYDNSLSAIATNQAQFAVQSVTVPRGSNINVNELNGMRFVSFTPQNVPGGGKPEPLQLSQSSPETFKFSEILSRDMQEISMINPALGGAPPPGVTSGVAIATLSANGMEFVNGIAVSYVMCIEKTLEHALNCYKKFGKLNQSVAIKSKNNKIALRDFIGDDLQNISGVKIQLQNPLMQTIAGRLEIAEKLLQMPKEVWPQYVSILEGEPLRDVYKGELSQNDLIFTENDLLAQGQATPALASDDHGLHAKEHSSLLNDAVIRANGKAIKVILDHILEHENLAKTTDRFFLAMIRTGKVPELPPEQGPIAQGGDDSSAPPPGPPGSALDSSAMNAAEPAQDMLGRG